MSSCFTVNSDLWRCFGEDTDFEPEGESDLSFRGAVSEFCFTSDSNFSSVSFPDFSSPAIAGGFDACSWSRLVEGGVLVWGDCEGDLEEAPCLVFGLLGSENGGLRLGDVFLEVGSSCGRCTEVLLGDELATTTSFEDST